GHPGKAGARTALSGGDLLHADGDRAGLGATVHTGGLRDRDGLTVVTRDASDDPARERAQAARRRVGDDDLLGRGTRTAKQRGPRRGSQPARRPGTAPLGRTRVTWRRRPAPAAAATPRARAWPG